MSQLSLSCYFISRLAIGNNSDPISVNQMKSISIFVHERGNFLYYKDQKKMPNSFQIHNNVLQLSIYCNINIPFMEYISLYFEYISYENINIRKWILLEKTMKTFLHWRKGTSSHWAEVTDNVRIVMTTTGVTALTSHFTGEKGGKVLI